MSGVIALIPRHLASLRICLPVSVAATPSMALNFRRSFVALAGSAVLTAVTASPTAAERVPRPPCTTTRNVASGCAAAASSRLCGTTGLLVARLPRSRTSLPLLADSMGTSQRQRERACERQRPRVTDRSAPGREARHRLLRHRPHLHPAPQAHSSGTDQKSRSGSRTSRRTNDTVVADRRRRVPLLGTRPQQSAETDYSRRVEQTKFLLDESQLPRRWYNVVADMPSPPQPVLHPGTGEPVGPDDLAPLFPMALIQQEVSEEAEIAIPGGDPRHVQPLASDAALPGAPARAGRRDEVADLLQVRGRQPARQPQAEHRRRAGVLQQAGGPDAALDRDRRRPVGERARVRVQADRPRVQGLHGSHLVRAEAVSALDDPAVGRGDRREPFAATRRAGARSSRSFPTRPAASGSRSRRRSRTRRSATTRRTRSAACSTTCSCTRR